MSTDKCESCFDCGHDALPMHTCPIQEDINDDFTYECNCCEDCTYECMMDI